MKEALKTRMGTLGATLGMTAAGLAAATIAPAPASACGSSTQSWCTTQTGCLNHNYFVETCCSDGGCSLDCNTVYIGSCC